MTEIVEQKIVSGCKNPFRTFYIAVMHYGVWLLIFLRKEQMQMKLVLAEKPSVAQSIAKVLGAAKREDGYLSTIKTAPTLSAISRKRLKLISLAYGRRRLDDAPCQRREPSARGFYRGDRGHQGIRKPSF